MDIKTQKIVAREILILAAAILFCLLGSLGIYFYTQHEINIQTDNKNQNEILNNKIFENKIKIEKLKQHNDTLYYLYNNLKTANLDIPDTYTSFKKTLTEDTQNRIKYFQYLQKRKYRGLPLSYDKFNEIYFANNNLSNPTDTIKLNKLQTEIEVYERGIVKTKVISYDIRHLIFIFCLISCIIIYPIRGLIFLLKWSIRTIRK